MNTSTQERATPPRIPPWRKIGVAVVAVCGAGAAYYVLSVGGNPDAAPPGGEARTSGIAVADCAPWDGAATSLFLAEAGVEGLPPSPPYLQIIVYQDGSTLPGGTIRLGEDQAGSGTAVRCDSRTACATADGGTIEFAAAADDSTLSGAYRLSFPDGTESGAFRARWTRKVALCG